MKKAPQRMCLGCRSMIPKSKLLRIVKSPSGAISFDATHKAPGRGAYICRSPECFNQVTKTKALARALKAAIPEEVYKELQEGF